MDVDITAIEAEDFLEIVWGDRPGWVDLPAKVGPYWVPFNLEWPSDLTVSRRIDSCLRDGESLYFSVCQFSERGRNYEDAMATDWLWADLDEVHPSMGADLGLMPTIAWQSSPGRYQALWKLGKKLSPGSLEKVNQALSYALGADRGGWDLTQVLRLPGTRNFKYPGGPPVELIWYHPALSYSATYVWETVKQHYQDPSGGTSTQLQRTDMPSRARALLRVRPDEVVEGERSARLWELECLLAESGWGEDEIYEAISVSAWNKWREVRTGERRLRREILKAMRHVRNKSVSELASTDRGGLSDGGAEVIQAGREELEVSDGEGDDGKGDTDLSPEPMVSPFVRYASFMAMAMEEPRWLIENIWTAGSHGILGGEPKTSKTSLALAAAVSVASGKPFLGEYPVHTQGPVLLVQEENAPWMIQDRMRKIARYYGLIGRRDYTEERADRGALGHSHVELQFPTDLDLRVLNNWGFNLLLEEHRDMLEAEVRGVGPALLILDPMYLVFGGVDTDRAKDLYPALRWLMQLRYAYNCAVMVVHHFSKKKFSVDGGTVRAGQRLLGSTTLHGWSDSALYTEAMESRGPGWVKTKVETEFRSMGPRHPLEIEMALGEPGDLKMEVDIRTWSLVGLIKNVLSQGGGSMAIGALADGVGHDKRTVLARVRGNPELFDLETGRRGRGYTHRVTLRASGG